MFKKMLSTKKFTNAMHTNEETIKLKAITSNDIANSAISHLYNAQEEKTNAVDNKIQQFPSIHKRVKQKTHPDRAVIIRLGA